MRYYILNGNINLDDFKDLVGVDNFILGEVGSFDIEGYLDGLVERGKNAFKREWEEWEEDWMRMLRFIWMSFLGGIKEI
jgi:hypothetical protein